MPQARPPAAPGRRCRCGWERQRRAGRHRPHQRLARQRPQELHIGYFCASVALAGPSPTTSLVPGRSRPGRPRYSSPPPPGRHRARWALHRAARRPAWDGNAPHPRRATRCANAESHAGHFALAGFGSPPSWRWRGHETSAASDRPIRFGTMGKRAWTYSGKRVWNEVEKAMPYLMQMRRADSPSVPSVAICTASGAKSLDLLFQQGARWKQRQADFRIGRHRHGESAPSRGVA